MAKKRFWITWCLNGHESYIEHPTLEEAKQEALRIAREEVKKVHVLECVGSAYPREAQWESVSKIKPQED